MTRKKRVIVEIDDFPSEAELTRILSEHREELIAGIAEERAKIKPLTRRLTQADLQQFFPPLPYEPEQE